jgi:hypothetical protein
MLGLIFSALAFAGCQNMIDRDDAELMVLGKPTGKPYLSCSTKDCVCIDGVNFEISKMDAKRNIVIDPEKQKLYLEKQRLEAEKKEADKIKTEQIRVKIQKGLALDSADLSEYVRIKEGL